MMNDKEIQELILALTAENMRLRNQVGSASAMTMTNNESDDI